MQTKFIQLITPTPEIAKAFNKWENDPVLIPLIRPNRNQAELAAQTSVTVATLTERLEHHFIYLIYLEEQLIGAMNFKIDFWYLYKKETGTAWIGMMIGEAFAREQGVGTKALVYLEKQIELQGLKRIELGVFACNTPALKLYKKGGYQEIGRIKKFTLWQGKMWSDIRMEKYLK
ncbi:MAG: GNAT family N-acetyltransferase [Proteobacteria bacterium]|nr:GNAT family N-acetyltransferase [Pseudomonadota bacterium]